MIQPTNLQPPDDSDSDEDRVYKHKHLYLIYSIKKRSSSGRVVFVFSSVDGLAGHCRMSYYGVRNELDATVVHVSDQHGAHGCYLFSVHGDTMVRAATIGLIRQVQEELGLTNEQTYLAGTSKGATTAVMYALMIGGGHVIAGEPQIRLGDFIYRMGWERNEEVRALAYAIRGRVEGDDREKLNVSMASLLAEFAPTFQGSMTILYGTHTTYWPRHIKHLVDIAESAGIRNRLELVEGDYASHNDVIVPFVGALKAKLLS